MHLHSQIDFRVNKAVRTSVVCSSLVSSYKHPQKVDIFTYFLCFLWKGPSKSWDIQFEIAAPQIVVPESFRDKKASVVGRLLESELLNSFYRLDDTFIGFMFSFKTRKFKPNIPPKYEYNVLNHLLK